VVICGGGLAGLCLARQLSLYRPELSVAIIDKQVRPLPIAGFKVGESSIDPGGKYFSNVLKLREYFEAAQLEKFGFRFFFPKPGVPFEERPEVGRSRYNPKISEYQFDRGQLENDLRAMSLEAGAALHEGAEIVAIELGAGEEPHGIVFESEGGARTRLRGKWVVDATGRRRMLQKQLGLEKDIGRPNSSCWFRVKGIIDVEQFVERNERNQAWFDRVPGDHPRDPRFKRWNSTMHLVDDGYWVWLIPLGTDYTSVGIVTCEDVHPFSGYNTFERACDWLAKHEPEVLKAIEGNPPIDFKCMKQFTYSSKQFISADRWAMTGEAAAFSDPFSANGCDLIGIENSLITEAIGLSHEGRLDAETAAGFNQIFYSYFETNTRSLQANYPFFGNGSLITMKFSWDIMWIMTFHGLFTYEYAFRYKVHELLRNREVVDEILAHTRTHAAVIALFCEWAQRGAVRHPVEWIDYFKQIPIMREVAGDVFREDLELHKPPSPTALEDFRRHVRACADMAHALFLFAVREILPERATSLPTPLSIDPAAITLDPSRWQTDGLFQPGSSPPNFGRIIEQFQMLFPTLGAARASATGA